MPLVKKEYKLFDQSPIRDNVIHLPSVLLDLTKGQVWSFEVRNMANQIVTVSLLGGSDKAPSSAGLVGMTANIAANTIEPVVTNVWMPYVGMQVRYAVAPIVGYITVTGWVQELS